jgi:hypothetical protein
MIKPQQTGIGEDELLDKFEHRMEFELLLNATQTAHARQILSDLMDTLEPQQPAEKLSLKEIKGKIQQERGQAARELYQQMFSASQQPEGACPFERIRDYPDCYEDCPDTDACPKKQPVEGERIPVCHYCSAWSEAKQKCLEDDIQTTSCVQKMLLIRLVKAHFDHMIQQGYRKLPDVDKLANEIRAIPDTTPCSVRAEKLLEWLKEQK